MGGAPMSRPGTAEFAIALDAAERMWRRDIDPHHLAKSVRYLYARNQELEHLLLLAERLVQFGIAEHDLSELRRTVQRLRNSQGLIL